MKTLFKTVIEKLNTPEAKAKFQAKQLPPVKFVDLYREQYYTWEQNEVFPCPSVLFEYNINRKNNTATVTIHCCFEDIRDTSSISKNQDKALSFFDFAGVVSEILEDLESQHTGKLELITEEQAKGDPIVNAYLLHYDCSYYKEKPNFNYVQAEHLETTQKFKDGFG